VCVIVQWIDTRSPFLSPSCGMLVCTRVQRPTRPCSYEHLTPRCDRRQSFCCTSNDSTRLNSMHLPPALDSSILTSPIYHRWRSFSQTHNTENNNERNRTSNTEPSSAYKTMHERSSPQASPLQRVKNPFAKSRHRSLRKRQTLGRVVLFLLTMVIVIAAINEYMCEEYEMYPYIPSPPSLPLLPSLYTNYPHPQIILPHAHLLEQITTPFLRARPVHCRRRCTLR
jgi:hypothetical protein